MADRFIATPRPQPNLPVNPNIMKPALPYMSPGELQAMLAGFGGMQDITGNLPPMGPNPAPQSNLLAPVAPQNPQALWAGLGDIQDVLGQAQGMPAQVHPATVPPFAMGAMAGAQQGGGNPMGGNIQQNQQVPNQGNGGMDFAKIIAALNAPHGRHLGMGGAEITQDNPQGSFGGDPFTNGFFKTRDQRIAKEMGTFGQSITQADHGANPLAAIAGTQPAPQTFGHLQGWNPFQGPQEPTYGSPVYRDQHPEFNPFSDMNWQQPNPVQKKKPVSGFGTGRNPWIGF